MNLKFSTIAVAILATVLDPPATADTSPPVTKHSGMCDASAAVPVGLFMFVVANDEDNTLRVYKRDESGEPIYSQDFFTRKTFLRISKLIKTTRKPISRELP